MERKVLFDEIRSSFSEITCYPGLREKWSKNNPTLGHCEIVALIIHDFLGGKIMRTIVNGASHYYNIVNNEIIDLTVEQFNGIIPNYQDSEERSREYLLSSSDTKSRYLLLLNNFKKNVTNIIENRKVENINYNIFKDKSNIIFDLDGTLIDSIGMWNNVDIELLTSLGKTPRNVGEERDKFLAENTHGDIYLNFAKHTIESYQIEGITPEELNEMRYTLARKYQINKLDLKDKVAEFLVQARKLGYTLTLATISTPHAIEIYAKENKKIRNKIDLYSIFNGGILTKESVTHKKPNPEVYLKAVELHNSRKEDCIVIEDSLSGVQAAKGAGIDTIAIYDQHADCDREKINVLADYTASNYKVLSKNILL